MGFKLFIIYYDYRWKLMIHLLFINTLTIAAWHFYKQLNEIT